MRITEEQFNAALSKRYKDIRDELKLLRVLQDVDPRGRRIRQLRAISGLAKLNGVDVKG